LKKRLEQDLTGEGDQALAFEAKFGNTMGLAMNTDFSTLPANGLSWLFWHSKFYQHQDRFFILERHL
jgi:cell division inhibitor SulA